MRLIDEIVVAVVFQASRLQPLNDLGTEIKFHSNPAAMAALANGVSRAAATEWVQDQLAWVRRHLDNPV